MNKQKLLKKIKETETKVPQEMADCKPLTEYANLAKKHTWQQRWNPQTRKLEDKPIEISGTVWSDAIEKSLEENNAVLIPAMPDPVWLDRSIIVRSGTHIIAHPQTDIRMIIGEEEHCLIRNKNIVSGQESPVDLCSGADKDILIQGGIWSDQKNNGAGPQGFRKGKEGLMLGSQGALVLSNVENIAIRNVTVKDNSSFGIQIGNARNFMVQGICVDGTKDGVHLEGPCELGIVRNIYGPLAGDDVVALNAWDWRTSSLTFGSITDILVEDTEVQKGSCAIRILPGVKIFPDGSTLVCDIERCIFKAIKNSDTFKMYDQPNVRCVDEDFTADLGNITDVFFENIHLIGLDLENYHNKSKNSVFELCDNARGLHFDDIYVNFEFGGNMPEFLMEVGPKSSIRPKPFVSPKVMQEIFNPNANPVVEDIHFGNIYLLQKDGEYVKHGNPAELIKEGSIPDKGKGTVVNIYVDKKETK